MRTLLASIVMLMLMACQSIHNMAHPSKPEARSVSVTVNGADLPKHEMDYLNKTIRTYISEYGFIPVAENPDVEIVYRAWGDFRGGNTTRTGFWGQQVGVSYWCHEGVFTIKHKGVVFQEDSQVNLQGYTTKQDLLNGLAWELVKPVTQHFKPQRPIPKAAETVTPSKT